MTFDIDRAVTESIKRTLAERGPDHGDNAVNGGPDGGVPSVTGGQNSYNRPYPPGTLSTPPLPRTQEPVTLVGDDIPASTVSGQAEQPAPAQPSQPEPGPSVREMQAEEERRHKDFMREISPVRGLFRRFRRADGADVDDRSDLTPRPFINQQPLSSAMTFDIDKAMSERFQKAEGFKMLSPGDGIYRDTASMRTLDESQKARDAGDTQTANKLLDDYDDNLESLYDSSETHVPNIIRRENGKLALGKPIKSPRNPDALATKYNKDGIYWDHPMMRPSAETARGNVPDDESAREQYIKQMNRKTGRSKRDLDTAVTEVAIGENPEYSALPPGRSIDAFIDQVIGNMQTGMSFEDAIDFVAESMVGRSLKRSLDTLKKSCDIDRRMAQWTAAGKARDSKETEAILRSAEMLAWYKALLALQAQAAQDAAVRDAEETARLTGQDEDEAEENVARAAMDASEGVQSRWNRDAGALEDVFLRNRLEKTPSAGRVPPLESFDGQ